MKHCLYYETIDINKINIIVLNCVYMKYHDYTKLYHGVFKINQILSWVGWDIILAIWELSYALIENTCIPWHFCLHILQVTRSQIIVKQCHKFVGFLNNSFHIVQ